MTDTEIRRLAHYVVLEACSNDDLLRKIANMTAKAQKPPKRLVSAKRAAEILGISVWQLYRIKEHFSYIKGGNSNSSALKFNEATLVDEYEDYLLITKKTFRLVGSV